MNYDAVFHPLLPPLPSIPHADYRDFLSVTVNVPTTCDENMESRQTVSRCKLFCKQPVAMEVIKRRFSFVGDRRDMTDAALT